MDIDIICFRCRSNEVRRDAFAAWSAEDQKWELCSVFDQGYCEVCGGESTLEEVPLTGDTEQTAR